MDFDGCATLREALIVVDCSLTDTSDGIAFEFVQSLGDRDHPTAREDVEHVGFAFPAD
jgi:hypothetical protein